MTHDELRDIVHNAIKPITSSVRELSGKFDDFRLATVKDLSEIKADVRHVRGGHEKLEGDVKELREGWPLIETHIKREEDTATFRLHQPPDKRSDSNLKVSIPKTSMKFLPWIIVAVLTGAFLAGGLIFGQDNSDDARQVMGEVRALADKTMKLTSEMKKVQKEISDGGEQK